MLVSYCTLLVQAMWEESAKDRIAIAEVQGGEGAAAVTVLIALRWSGARQGTTVGRDGVGKTHSSRQAEHGSSLIRFSVPLALRQEGESSFEVEEVLPLAAVPGCRSVSTSILLAPSSWPMPVTTLLLSLIHI